MKYVKNSKGVILCEHCPESCGTYRAHGGHSLIDLLPEDSLKVKSGDNCCIGCAQVLPPGISFGDLCIWGQHGMCMANVAARVAHRFGGIDGDHHKQWVIDQMLRAILGKRDYQAWVVRMNANPDYEPWDTGIAP